MTTSSVHHPVRHPRHEVPAVHPRADLRLWELVPGTSPADRAYVLVTPGPGGPGSVPDGRCGLGFVDGVVWWFGPQTRPWPSDRAGVRVLGLRLSLLGGRPVAGCPLGGWRDRRAPLAQLWDAATVDALTARLRAASGDEERLRLLLAAAGRRARPTASDTFGRRLADLVTADLPVAAVARDLGVSPRRVHQCCVDTFGLPPSVLRRTVRLHRAARLHATGGPGQNLADLAQAAGYADQAHLSREFRALTGLSPRQALAAALPICSRHGGPVALRSRA